LMSPAQHGSTLPSGQVCECMNPNMQNVLLSFK